MAVMRRHLLFTAAVFVPQLVGAQAITVLPRVGVFTQTKPFRMHFNQPPREFQQTWHYRFEESIAFGAAAEVHFPKFWPPVRVEINHAPSLDLKHKIEHLGPPLFGDASGAITTATVAAVLTKDRLCWRSACPRIVIGGGAKKYRFDAKLLRDDVIDSFAPDQTVATLQTGLGVHLRLARINVTIEANDFSNRVRFTHQDLPSGRVHDTIVTFGLSCRP